MHPDHFNTFCERTNDHHDLLHNGFLLLTQAAATLKTQFMSGGIIGGVTGKLPFQKEQKEYFLRPTVTSYASVWDTEEQKTRQYVPPVRKLAHVLPETPLMTWKSKGRYHLPDCSTLYIDGPAGGS